MKQSNSKKKKNNKKARYIVVPPQYFGIAYTVVDTTDHSIVYISVYASDADKKAQELNNKEEENRVCKLRKDIN